MQKISLNIRKKGTHKISVIPTMGALHEGHLSLIKKAREKKIITIVTIFVNPIQFDDKKDLTNYPSNLKNDIHKLKSIGVNYLFTPNIKDIYPEGYKTKVVVEDLKNHLCGLKRPGHFDGVTSVVLKIFNITLPHKAFFGEKDLGIFKVKSPSLLLIVLTFEPIKFMLAKTSGSLFSELTTFPLNSR